MPFSVVTRRTWPIFFELVALVDAPLTVKSLTTTPTSPAVDLREADNLAVARGLGLVFREHAGRAQQSGFDEGAGIDQCIEPLLGVQVAAFLLPGKLFLTAHRGGGFTAAVQLAQYLVMGHGMYSPGALASLRT